MELCEQASTEQNPEKLIKLTAEIIRLLGEKNKRLHDPPATPNEPRRLNSGSTRIHEVQELHNVSGRLDSLAEQHPHVSEALITISGSIRNTPTLLEVLVALRMYPVGCKTQCTVQDRAASHLENWHRFSC